MDELFQFHKVSVICLIPQKWRDLVNLVRPFALHPFIFLSFSSLSSILTV